MKRWLIILCFFKVLTLVAQDKDSVAYYNEISKSLESYFNPNLSTSERTQLKNAIFMFSQNILKHPNNASFYFNRGAIYAKLGLHPNAINDYNRAIRIDSTFADVYYHRGLAKARFAFTKVACRDIKKAVSLGMTNITGLYNARCIRFTGHLENK